MKKLLKILTITGLFGLIVGAGVGAGMYFDYIETPDNIAKLASDANESWHDRFVADNCERCPECCVTTLWDSIEAEVEPDAGPSEDAGPSKDASESDASGADAAEADAK